MSGDPEREAPERCDFCRLQFPEPPVEMEHEGETYRFCCQTCREAMEESDRVFTDYRGYHRFWPGVSALDAALPQGMLRNSLVLLSEQAGSRSESIHAELIWRALERGKPAVYVTFQEPPMAVVEEFLTMDWNVLPYLESGQLHVLDAFSYRVDDQERMYDRMNDWNHHLHRMLEPATTQVRDATDTSELANKLDSCLEALAMVDTGVVLIDSLTELGTLVQPVQAYSYVKDLRADVCKGRFVPVFAGATFGGDASAFPHDLDYVADGVVDMELNGDIVEDTLVKRTRIRKMSGVLAYSEWTAYEYTAGIGMVTFDPQEEMRATGDDTDDADRSGMDTDDRADPGGDDGSRPDGDDGSQFDGEEGSRSGPSDET
jgi:KaiC/GvpD/RAD55 family RecA-like ATPase